MSTPLKVNTPFYTAGSKYGWPGKKIGIGIAGKHLKGEASEILEITVGEDKEVWIIEKGTARDLAAKYDSYYVARGTTLSVIPWHEFRRKSSATRQLKLF